MAGNRMKTIALVAHDNKKKDIVEWCDFNKGTLSQFCLYATGSTGEQIIEKTGLPMNLLKSGPYGGDMELGALIANKKLRYSGILLGSFRVSAS